ncbi:MAG: DUF3592 domain-containing protein, partial [Coprococcus sp.]
MKNKNGESRVGKILGISFFATGVLMLVIAIVCAFFSWNTKKNSEKVIGTITEIYSIREDGYNRNNGISVEYFYDGQEYEADISEYSSNMRVGRRISLYVNKKDPQRVRTSGLLFLPTLVLCCIGIPF